MGETSYEATNVRSEFPLHVFEGAMLQIDHIVKQSGRDAGAAQTDFAGNDTSHSQRMAYVGIPIKASVAAVRILRKVESPFEQFRLVAVARMLVVFKQTFKLLLYHHLLFGSDRFGSRLRLGFLFCLFSCVYDVHGYILINSNLGKAQLLSRVDAIGLQLVEFFDFCRRGVMFAGDGSQGFAFAHSVDATTARS